MEYHSIIFIPSHSNDVNMLKEFNIDFSKLKKFAFLGDTYFCFEKNFNFLKLINSLNIKNNLVYFEFKGNVISKREPSEFEFINNLKSLKYLGLFFVLIFL